MKELIICKGLPGSGKTTWAKQHIKDNPNFVRVNRDDIRAQLGVSFNEQNEKLVKLIRNYTITTALLMGYNVISDDTNLMNGNWYEKLLHYQAIDYKVDVVINDSFLDIPIEECIRRDLQRDNPVGEENIRKMLKEYEKINTR